MYINIYAVGIKYQSGDIYVLKMHLFSFSIEVYFILSVNQWCLYNCMER